MFIQKISEENDASEDEKEIPIIFKSLARISATLGHVKDFPSDWFDISRSINVGETDIQEHNTTTSSRSRGRR